MWYRTSQWYNPIRVIKNWQNMDEESANQDNPDALLHLIRLNLVKLYQNSQERGLVVGLDPAIQPTVVSLIGQCVQIFDGFARVFDSQPPGGPTASSKRITRHASLSDGLSRDINDVKNLLSNLSSNTALNKAGGSAVYQQIKNILEQVDNILNGVTVPQQAMQQLGQPAPTATPSIASTPTTPTSSQSIPSAYSAPGETYNSKQYQQNERQPGTAEWNNEVQNYLAWGIKNGGLTALVTQMQQDQHTAQFVTAVQSAWQAKGLGNTPPPSTP